MRYYKLNADGSVVYSCTTKPINEEVLYLEDAPTKYHKWDGSKWVEDTTLKTEIDNNQIKIELSISDSGMIRVVEDLIKVLVAKGIITESDFDIQVITKLRDREALREKLN